MEIVANLAVWLGGECQVGQMIDWFGSYDRTSGLSARLLLRKPANEGSERDFQVACRHPSIRWKAATTEPFPRLSISFFLPGCGPAAARIRSPETCGKPQGQEGR